MQIKLVVVVLKIPLGSCLQPTASTSTAEINNFPVRLPPAGGNYKVTTGREGIERIAIWININIWTTAHLPLP